MIDRELSPDETIVYVTNHPNDWYLRRLVNAVGRRPMYRLSSPRLHHLAGTYLVIPRDRLRGLDDVRGVYHKPYIRLCDFDLIEPFDPASVIHRRARQEETTR